MSTDVLASMAAISGESAALVPASRHPGEPLSIEARIGQWLHAKFQRSNSERTVEEYRAVLGDFRSELQRAGLDLGAGDVQDLGARVQVWAARKRARDGRPVSASTHNRRLAILSSFYTYAKRHDMLDATGEPIRNPVELVERARVQAYAAAQALDAGDVADQLAAIDRATLAGKRDYALLSLALSTGRRVSELAALRARHIRRRGQRVTITWERTKGNKRMEDEIPAPVAAALDTWLYATYGPEAATLANDAPLWLGLGPNVKTRRPLSTDAIADVCAKRLGVSKVHATRHTFAVLMEQVGAKLSDIQARLGHSNAATTGVYMQRLHASENTYAAGVAALLKIGTPAKASTRGPRRVTRPLAHRSAVSP